MTPTGPGPSDLLRCGPAQIIRAFPWPPGSEGKLPLSLKWIAEPPAMGSLTHVSNLLVAERKRERLKSEN
jgi:hypothetical protein